MQVTETQENILVTGVIIHKIEQAPARSFQTFKKLNKHNWGLDGLSKKAADKVIGMCNIIYARRKDELRKGIAEEAIKLIRDAKKYSDVKLEKKTDAKGNEHAVIKLAQKPTKMTKAGEEVMASVAKEEADKRAKEQEARIAALEASLAAYKAKGTKGTKGTKEAAMLPEFA